jgi:hypothetical protein
VRTYVVQVGDSPAKIAIQFAGCPKCAIDLIKANPHKPSVRYPNGFLSFSEMRVGEKITLPGKWFSGELDELPPSYFAALPHPDGVTPTKGHLGALGDYATLENASLDVSSLASMDDETFHAEADGVASLIDTSVQEAKGTPLAETVYGATKEARRHNEDLGADLSAGTSTAEARLETQNSLSIALGVARVALKTFYAANPTYEVDIGPATIEPPAPAPAPPPAAPPPAPPPVAAMTAPEKKGITTGAIVGTLVGVGVVGGAIYWVVNNPPRKRVRRVKDDDDRETC